MKRKILSLLLCIALVVTMLPAVTVAADPVAAIGSMTYASLAEAFAAVKTGDTVTLLGNVTLAEWTAANVNGKSFTLNGNNKTISGLTAPLFNAITADVTVKNLTVTGANIAVTSAAGIDNDTAAGAIASWAYGGDVVFENVTVSASTIAGDGYVGGYVGFADHPVGTITVKGGTVSGNTLTAGGAVGGLVGHTYVSILVDGTVFSGNTITSTSDNGTRPDKVGVIAGRLTDEQVGETISVNATVEANNTLAPVNASTYNLIGSIVSGSAVITGGTYPTNPLVIQGNIQPTAAVGFLVKENGSVWTVTTGAASVGGTTYETLDEAVADAVTEATASASAEVALPPSNETSATITTVVDAVAAATSSNNAEVAVTVPTAEGTVTFDNKAVQNIAAESSSAVTLSIENVTENHDVVANDLVFEITLEDATGAKVAFGTDETSVQDQGLATVRIPLPAGMTSAKVLLLKDDGTTEDMNATIEAGYAVFTTPHFSLYKIEEQAQTAVVGTVISESGKYKLSDHTAVGTNGPALTIKSPANVVLELEGTNSLTGAAGYAGIYVEKGATLTIAGTGKLASYGGGESNERYAGAGIGGNGDLKNPGTPNPSPDANDIINAFGTIIINGGEIVASGAGTGNNGSAGIGGGGVANYRGYFRGYDDPENPSPETADYTTGISGAIVINGGTVTATGGAAGNGGAGIGSGSCNADATSDITITITGGTVTATGGACAAGIGSGSNVVANGKITITGGVIEATGTDGAGIGGGDNGYVTEIEIGGTAQVEATGSGSAAAIGGGWAGSVEKITIGGNATVEATAAGAAAIGAGKSINYGGDSLYGGTAEEIIISGSATVTASTTADNAAAIGGAGEDAAVGTIEIKESASITTSATGTNSVSIGASGNGEVKDVVSITTTGTLALDKAPFGHELTSGTLTPKTFTVTYDVNGGSALTPNTKTVSYGQPYGTLATPTRAGWFFLGWYTAKTDGVKVTSDTLVTLTDNVTLYALWSEKPVYNVYFYSNGGEVSIPYSVTDTDGKLATLPVAVRYGYIFDGWYTAAGVKVVEKSTVFTQDTFVIARWRLPVTYTIRYDANGGFCEYGYTVTNTDGRIGYLPDATRDGYLLEGWFTAPEGGRQITAGTVFDRNTTIYAHWMQEDVYVPYIDVAPSDWYFDDVMFTYYKGLMNGVGGYEFAPNKTLNRATLVTTLWRLSGSPKAAGGNTFTDLAEGTWYTDAMKWAIANGIIEGYGDNTCRPLNNITHEQVCAILRRYASLNGRNADAPSWVYNAPKYSTWAKDDALWAVNNGVYATFGSDVSDLTKTATRGEVAAYLQVICNLLGK